MDEILPHKKVSGLLGTGIFFMPYIFGWFTLKDGYSKNIRTVTFIWMAIVVVMLSTNGAKKNNSPLQAVTVDSSAQDTSSNKVPKIFGDWQCSRRNHPDSVVQFRPDGFSMSAASTPVWGQYEQNGSVLILDANALTPDGQTAHVKYNAEISKLDQHNLIFTIPFGRGRNPSTLICTK